jgi:hypothetical protein
MKILALISLLIAAVISTSSVHGEEVPKFAGEWVWIIKQGIVLKVNISEDGSCAVANAKNKGTWHILPNTGCVEFKWENGATDTLSFKNSKLVLVGTNGGGDMIIAAKIP